MSRIRSFLGLGALLAGLLAGEPASAQNQVKMDDWIRLGIVGTWTKTTTMPNGTKFTQSGNMIGFKHRKTHVVFVIPEVSNLLHRSTDLHPMLRVGEFTSHNLPSIQDCSASTTTCLTLLPWDHEWTASLLQRGGDPQGALELEREYRQIHATLLLNQGFNGPTAERLRSSTLRFRRSLAALLQQTAPSANGSDIQLPPEQTLAVLTHLTETAEVLTYLIDVLQHP